jgi:shikimate dehydrogenase
VPRLGVLGWPVAHSRSPAIQNAALHALGLSGTWRYQLLPVPPDEFAETVAALGTAGFAGANVTIPHKEAALTAASGASEAATAIGAANTLTFTADGGIEADNTDAPGLIDALDTNVAGLAVLVLGAGGSARAAAWALREAGARDVAVWNRTPARAKDLARNLDVRVVDELAAADILVHCTPIGLDGTDAALALGIDPAAYGTVVDLVYAPGGTPLIRRAADAGCVTVDGLEVLVRQGARSLQIWTGRTPSLDVMREAAA